MLPEKFSVKIAASGPAVQCPVRRYQRPIIGSDGQATRDDDGQTLIARVAEPADTTEVTPSRLWLIRRQGSPPQSFVSMSCRTALVLEGFCFPVGQRLNPNWV